jgi:hypothetical protein
MDRVLQKVRERGKEGRRRVGIANPFRASVPKGMVAPKTLSNAPTSRRCSWPPVCIPNVSSISAAVRNRIVWLFCWTARVARKIGTSRSWPNGTPYSGCPVT